MSAIHESIERFFRSGLKLPHLRILVSLADLGQVTRVASAFHVTQPAISKQIAEIEHALGVPVVNRSGNSVELTGIGQVIVACGRDVLRHIEMARRDVSALASGTGGHVRLGAVVTIPEPLTVNAVQLFLRRAPNASLSFVEATLDRLIKQLEDGDLDVALGRNRVNSMQTQLKQETLHREPFVFVAGAHHPLGAPERALDWHDLNACRWITPLHGSPAYATLIETLTAHDLALAAGSVESSSLALNLALLQGGEFLSILPLSVARQHAMRGTMRVLPLPPLEPLGEVVAYWRADATLPAAQLFVACLREASNEALGE
ncbi:LysR family transcriptional regulator [Paraburkholderia caballeronis]|uniref:DNA-binding transcriptional regulator, LysR family n=1 Tax=Paraburkholderia caballeronis TaxID=416943 RepID=A0A1H7P0C9_9BURK|nr:LysR family transcriptional regulator [Paraburkholderia caballeronis]PXW25443.1 LysR family transcriptional regulator [Paraburkholderia caballeronis]PXX01050.1 LysR family transcriptional regulator [Paraburkholderia caballeronis]RAJ99597.1 LysR family transcriptional regulator [Paraburkholderia caballeronis]TDV11424.1 LysR family transcriptional regulator [Paraburkholderia caballeronis]TDV14614.1 LysR family transcriptional regulator [Paraburkholderia caballeronis]